MKTIINTLQSGLSLEGFGALLSRLFPSLEEICFMHNNGRPNEAMICCCCDCCC